VFRPADMSSPALATPVRYDRLRLARIGSGFVLSGFGTIEWNELLKQSRAFLARI
jgi:hypothetical protein